MPKKFLDTESSSLVLYVQATISKGVCQPYFHFTRFLARRFQLQNSIEKLIRQNEELLRKNTSLQKQGRMIVEEKMEIIRRLERTEEANIQLRRMLSDTDRACKDLQQASQVDDEPRFTLAELREVLQEKNVLKGRVMELEEELENLRPGRKERERDDLLRYVDTLCSRTDDGEEMLVYGPLPREPDEKLYPWKYERKDSGVRKL
ncbi:unnamed protein product [Nippostrongylus brasiliensis]|uniref:RILP-like protein 1 (inferred by orthology to a human protein) n=1 Tax=Nippostrongylus brasiliensis TaxID=27835 RepID=A0A0N4XH20_NIPBR|nr:unnamed protein product [Nippostrongylus brasiliensis]